MEPKSRVEAIGRLSGRAITRGRADPSSRPLIYRFTSFAHRKTLCYSAWREWPLDCEVPGLRFARKGVSSGSAEAGERCAAPGNRE